MDRSKLIEALAKTWPAQMAKSAYDAARLPGDVARGIMGTEPAVPGMWSDEDESRAQATGRTAVDRAADLAGLVMGGTYAGAPRGAVGAGPVRPAAEMDKLRRALERSGIAVDGRHGSGLSRSDYLGAMIPDWSGATVGPLPEGAMRTVKVRSSDHDLPPTYGILNGRPDVEIGPHGAAIGDWTDAAKWIFREAGMKPDARTQSSITRVERRWEAERAAKAAADAEYRVAMDKINAIADIKWQDLLSQYGLSGISRPAGVTNPKSMMRFLNRK